MKNFQGLGKILNRDELKKVVGGNIVASCTAKCGKSSISCSGTSWTASDGIGCTSDTEFKVC